MQSDDLKQSKRFFVIDWLISLKLAAGNREKIFLYSFIGMLIALVYILSMLVIKQYIQRRNLYRKLSKPDIHEYESQSKSTKTLKTTTKPQLQAKKNENSSNQTKTNKIPGGSSSNLSHKLPKEVQNNKPRNSSRISKSSTNIYSDSSADSQQPMLPNNQQQSSQYERLNNHFNQNFHNSNSFANHSHSNLYDYANTNNFDNYEGFKLITRNGSTKIVNGQNDDISEYEIPIIRYNDRSMIQQYSNN